MVKHSPLVLLVLDGWGIAPPGPGNAIALAKTPTMDRLLARYPHTELHACGVAVGLPKGVAGNSEAGHMNIGAGRVVVQDATVIDQAIQSGNFFTNRVLLETLQHVKRQKSHLQVMSMVSEGHCSPHSCLHHVLAMIDMAFQNKIKKVYFHLFTDGRDSGQHTAHQILAQIQARLPKKAGYDYRIVSVIGRYFAMDRARRWQRTQKAYECLVAGHGQLFLTTDAAIDAGYAQDLTDEYLEPSVIAQSKSDARATRIRHNDGIVFMGLRSDRARQLTKAFVQSQFTAKNKGAFRRSMVLKNTVFCALTDFGDDLNSHVSTAFPSQQMSDTLPSVLKHYRQYYIAEAEKFAHVTYFLNGGFGHPVNGEKRIKIPSSPVRHFTDKPEMSARPIAKKVVQLLDQGKADVIVANFANADMIGHTGDIAATKQAITCVDQCLGQIVAAVRRVHGTCVITADHGNAEYMIRDTDRLATTHSLYPVPFILVNDRLRTRQLRASGKLADIAPTLYDILAIESPPDITGTSLLLAK